MATWSVAKLAERFSPFNSTVWFGLKSPITREEVKAAIVEMRLKDTESPDFGWGFGPEPWDRLAHIERVAWLVVHGWSDDIDVDVGCENLGCYVDWWIEDGNHRLAAAIYRGDLGIEVSPGGDTSVFEEFEVR